MYEYYRDLFRVDLAIYWKCLLFLKTSFHWLTGYPKIQQQFLSYKIIYAPHGDYSIAAVMVIMVTY